ncbi:hypothetical protein [Photobacterium damselae]|uniref:hypothetical protein n=1 Tax=Photobacterium damselae TaxID=38293 RepID=UPI000D6603C4|nr:hypothetical protein [Photobacterium damselae]AWK84030.1 hypothetical protein BST98_18775 [Photobacterium damselae]
MGFFDLFSDFKRAVGSQEESKDEKHARYRREVKLARKTLRQRATVKAFDLWVSHKMAISEEIVKTDADYIRGLKMLHNIHCELTSSNRYMNKPIAQFKAPSRIDLLKIERAGLGPGFLSYSYDSFYAKIDEQFCYPDSFFYFAKKDPYIIFLNDKMLSKLPFSSELYCWENFYREIIKYSK